MSVASSQLAWVPGGPRGSILLLLLLLLLFQVTDPSHHHSAPDPTPPPQPCTKLPVLPLAEKLQKDRKGQLCPQAVAKGHGPAWHRLLLVILVGGKQIRNLGEERGEQEDGCAWLWERSSFPTGG